MSKLDKITSSASPLDKLREPFPSHQISVKPQGTKAQNEALKSDRTLGVRCSICGQWHHRDAIHLSYVGHAALTDRLLDCDPTWNWEPMASAESGAPILDGNGGMWIKLTVCGVTRIGYGHPDGKTGGNAVKETIGDALRNAAMRFGAALDLWHKGDLHIDADDDSSGAIKDAQKPRRAAADAVAIAAQSLTDAESVEALKAIWADLPKDIQSRAAVIKAKDARKAALTPIVDDEIPY